MTLNNLPTDLVPFPVSYSGSIKFESIELPHQNEFSTFEILPNFPSELLQHTHSHRHRITKVKIRGMACVY